MSRKNTALRVIDTPPSIAAGGATIDEVSNPAPPAIPTIPKPTGLTVTGTVIARSAQASQVYINIVWNAPESITPQEYLIEYGKTSAYNVTTELFSESLKVNSEILNASLLADTNTSYTIRVCAVYRTTYSDWSDIVTVVTPQNLEQATQIPLVSAQFNNGDVVITWTEPDDPLYKDAEIKIYNTAETTLYGTFYVAGGKFVWTEAQNFAATSNAGVTDVKINISSRSWANVITSPPLSTTASLGTITPISSVTSDFSTGALTLKWTNPSIQFKYIQVDIYADSSKVTRYRTMRTVTNNITWSVEMNLSDTGNNPDVSVYVEIKVIGYLNKESTIVSNTYTKSPPGTPSSVTHSWSGDDGTYQADILFSWSAVDNAIEYELLINGTKSKITRSTYYAYSFDENVADNGTADPTLTYQVRARDALKQYGVYSASATATNVSPSNTFYSITTTSAWNAISIFITNLTSNTTVIKDFLYWEIRLVQSGSTIKTIRTTQLIDSILVDARGTYDIQVYLVDKFNQYSAAKTANSIVTDFLTIAELRSTMVYADGINTTTALNVLKDNVVSSGGITYVANMLYFIQGRRELIDRTRDVTLSMTASGSTLWYLRTSNDNGATWRYFAGPLQLTANTGLSTTLTEQSSQANAVANRVSHTALGNPSSNRVTLPSIVEANIFEIIFINTTNNTRVDEFYPRRLIQGDDIEVESIKAYNVAANAINGTHIVAGVSLSAPLITAGTITGATIQTATSGERIVMNASSFISYDSSNVVQVQIAGGNGGAITAAGGAVKINATGIRVLVPSSTYNETNSYSFVDSNGKNIGGMFTKNVIGISRTAYVKVEATQASSPNGYADAILELVAGNSATTLPSITIYTLNNAPVYKGRIDLFADERISFSTPYILMSNGGLAVGSNAGTPNVGEVRATAGLIGPRTVSNAVWTIDAAQIGTTISIPNLGLVTPFTNANVFAGEFMVQDNNSGVLAKFAVGGNVMVKVYDTHNVYSTTFGTAGKINVYVTGAGIIAIDNRIGSTVNLIISGWRLRNFC